MRDDVLKWANGAPTGKRVSKETLNHRGLIERVSGLDVYQDTPEAFRRAYEALGVDIINRVPLANAPQPTPEGESRPHEILPYNYGSLGVYDTVMRHSYPCEMPEDVWDFDVVSLRYENLLVPVPHPCAANDIKEREKQDIPHFFQPNPGSMSSGVSGGGFIFFGLIRESNAPTPSAKA